MLSEEIRTEIRPRLEAAFQDRFRGVLLFGSEARNQAGEDSDVDLMVLLQGPVRLGMDLETIVDALYPLQLKVDRSRSPWRVDRVSAGDREESEKIAGAVMTASKGVEVYFREG